MLLNEFLNNYSEDNKWYGLDEDSNGYLVMYREPIKKDKVKRIKKFELFNCDYCGQNAIRNSYSHSLVRKKAEGVNVIANLCSRQSAECFSKHITLGTIEAMKRVGGKKWSRENPRLSDYGYLSWKEHELDESGHRVPNGRGKNKSYEVFLHVVLMEEHIGRKLAPDECVHHIDGDKLNNKIDNLWLCNKSSHMKAHRSIEGLLKGLMKRNITKFNRKTGKYELNNQDD